MDPRIQQALELIETAQSLMLEAAQTLSPVDGFANQWSATVGMYEKVKQHWHKVNHRRIDLQARHGRRATTRHETATFFSYP
jgi:hypothetical protein